MVKVGITQGDINGVGLELIIKTLMNPTMMDICTPIVFGSNKTASYHRKALGIEDFSFNQVRDVDQANAKKPNLVSIYEEEVTIELGQSTALGGQYALKSLESATIALQNGKIDVLVTAPINKHNIQSDSFKFPGHTEYLEDKFGTKGLMLLCSDNLKVGVVTGHIPITNIASSITTEKILAKIKILECYIKG